MLKELSKIELVNLIYQYGANQERQFTKLVNRISAHSYEILKRAEMLEKKVMDLENVKHDRDLEEKRIILGKRMKKREKASRRRLRYIQRMQDGPPVDANQVQDFSLSNFQEDI